MMTDPISDMLTRIRNAGAARVRTVEMPRSNMKYAVAKIMQAEGFLANPYEWWHFTAPEWSRYPAADRPLPSR